MPWPTSFPVPRPPLDLHQPYRTDPITAPSSTPHSQTRERSRSVLRHRNNQKNISQRLPCNRVLLLLLRSLGCEWGVSDLHLPVLKYCWLGVVESPVKLTYIIFFHFSTEVICEKVQDGLTGEPREIQYTHCKIVGNGSFGVVFQTKLSPSGEDAAIKRVLQDKRFKVWGYLYPVRRCGWCSSRFRCTES